MLVSIDGGIVDRIDGDSIDSMCVRNNIDYICIDPQHHQYKLNLTTYQILPVKND